MNPDKKREYQAYCDLLQKSIHDLESMSREIEFETINKLTNKPDQDIIFSTVPLLRKLNDAKQEALFSLNLFTQKLTKL